MTESAWWEEPGHGRFCVDASLPYTSEAWHNVFPQRHVLLRPYVPERIREVPGCEYRAEHLRTIVMPQRDRRHPAIWGWVLAIREADLALDPALEPGVMVIFKRYSCERVGLDKPAQPRWLGDTLPCDVTHIDNIECVFSPALVEQRMVA